VGHREPAPITTKYAAARWGPGCPGRRREWSRRLCSEGAGGSRRGRQPRVEPL